MDPIAGSRIERDPAAKEEAALYLDLMKRCLTDFIYFDDKLSHYVLLEPTPDLPLWKRLPIGAVGAVLGLKRIRLVRPYSRRTPEEIRLAREGGWDWPPRAHTMIGLKRLDHLQRCVERVLADGIPGDLIETGVWRGGACIFMRAILKAYGEENRTVWVADSFAGLPRPDAAAYPDDAGDLHHRSAQVLAVSREQVAANFRRYGLLDDRVRFVEGWFKDSLPAAPIERLAILRLDGDMYESTIQALDALYDKVSPGGYVIVDDYYLEPCAKAVHDFRAAHGIEDELCDIDGVGAFWRRPSEATLGRFGDPLRGRSVED